jgi:hypothetical protein
LQKGTPPTCNKSHSYVDKLKFLVCALFAENVCSLVCNQQIGNSSELLQQRGFRLRIVAVQRLPLAAAQGFSKTSSKAPTHKTLAGERVPHLMTLRAWSSLGSCKTGVKLSKAVAMKGYLGHRIVAQVYGLREGFAFKTAPRFAPVRAMM